MAAPRAKDQAKPDDQRPSSPRQNLRENFRARMNENVVTIMAGSPSGTDLAIVQDLAEVLDDGDKLRVLPMVGKGPEQNIKDVMFLRGVDMGVTQANLLKHFDQDRRARPEPQGPDRLYRQAVQRGDAHPGALRGERHPRSSTANPSISAREGSGTEITGRLIFAALGVDAQEVHLTDTDAIQKLKDRRNRRHHRGDGQARAGARQPQGDQRAQAAGGALRQVARGRVLSRRR